MGVPFECAFHPSETKSWNVFPSLPVISRNMCTRQEGKSWAPGPSLASADAQMLRLPSNGQQDLRAEQVQWSEDKMEVFIFPVYSKWDPSNSSTSAAREKPAQT